MRIWLKGKPVTALPAKGLAVVEFWATWCGPCRQTIPELTELAKANPDILVIGAGIWEDHDPKVARQFLTMMGPKMDYRVGYSGNQDGMAKTWMQAAGATSIPTAFLVQDRRIAWIGHPDELPSVIKRVKRKEWSVTEARKTWAKQARRGEQLTKIAGEAATVYTLYQKQGVAEAVESIRRLRGVYEAIPQEMDDLEISYLAEYDWEAWTKLVRSTLKQGREDTRVSIVDAAWRIINDEPRRALARRILEFGLEAAGPTDFTFAFSAARAYEHGKMPSEALKMLDLAERNIPKGEQEAPLRNRLAAMRINLHEAILKGG